MHTQIFRDISQSHCPSPSYYVRITLHRELIGCHISMFQKSTDHHLHRIKASRIHLLYQIGKDYLQLIRM